MTYLLHIDTSTDKGIVAISCNGAMLAFKINEEARSHASALNNMINDILKETKITFGQISAIAVCGGPGSYTGLRIGMATAKGLCYALDKPLLNDSRLALLAYRGWLNHGNKYDKYITLLIARSNEYFICIYDNNFGCILPPQHITEQQLISNEIKKENLFIISNAPESEVNKLGINIFIDTNIETDLKSWASYAFEEYNCNSFVNLATCEPLYLKQVYTHK